MKLNLILTFALVRLTFGEERGKRSTVLTDESKRILEQFDFSNFDKQEALNYIDRQRYDNQIRGKRSKSKLRRHVNYLYPNYHEGDASSKGSKSDSNDCPLDKFSTTYDGYNAPWETVADGQFGKSTYRECGYPDAVVPSGADSKIRKRRGHRPKKKHKFKQMQKSFTDEDYEEGDAREEWSCNHKKKRKKKKRHYWDRWSQWSPCSVTCGRGRQIRWRKCIAKNCTTGDLEMGEKTCQLPACNLLTKLLGI